MNGLNVSTEGSTYGGFVSQPNNNYENGGIFGGMNAQQEAAYVGADSDTGYGSVASGIVTAGMTLLSSAAKIDGMNQRTKEIEESMKATTEEYEFMASVNEQQMEAVDRVAGDKMSITGLERLKNKASLTASAAMTGTAVGKGTTNNVVQEAAIVEMMDNAVIVQQARYQKVSLRNKLQGQYMSATNRLNNLAAGIQSPAGGAFAMIDAGLQGFTKGYMMLPPSERRKYFGYQG